MNPKQSMGPTHKIPDELSHAFGEALILLVQWQGGAEEPVVKLDGRPFRITAVFGIVESRKFTDLMPKSMVKLLLTYASQEPARRPQYDQIAILPTYKIGAHCLLKWFNDKKSSAKS